MDKQHVLDEIKRTAKANGGVPLGRRKFELETGIRSPDWDGKFWARWSDAVLEAGFEPNTAMVAYDEAFLFEKMIGFIRELGHYPVRPELRIKARNDKSFPSDATFSRFASPKQLAAKIIAYCQKQGLNDDVIQICSERIARDDRPAMFKSSPHTDGMDTGSAEREQMGFVYLLKSGRYYKIGKTNAAGRRERELAIQLPEKANTVHIIKTDDPTGIEAYWHKRFEDNRKHGEWFELSSAEVNAFKRRKFM